MTILHRYILKQLVRNLLLFLLISTLLFLVIDFFDRIDNIMAAGGSFISTVEYFLYKVPLMLNLMLPVAILVSTLFTFGILSKNSEIVAMRAAGLSIFWLARPLFITGIGLSIISLIVDETIVPLCTRRVKEVYNIDIQQKDKKGSYSQANFWWRQDNRFFSVSTFDSRTNRMHGLSLFDLRDNFEVERRIDSEEASYLDSTLGWSMSGVTEFRFSPNKPPDLQRYTKLPLPMTEEPEEFYDVKTDPDSMSYRSLRKFIKQQAANGIPVIHYMADLHQKLAFPFINFFICIVALPFALKSARSGSLATGFVAGMLIGFSYYAVNSFGIAMGRAEFMPPLLAAWTANILMGFIGLVLNLGAESPG